MKRALFAVLLLLCAACAKGHYIEVQDETLRLCVTLPEAKVVQFAFSLDGFRKRDAERLDNCTWCVGVPGGEEFRYFYIVDGKAYIPACRFTEKDDFGSENCVYVPGM